VTIEELVEVVVAEAYAADRARTITAIAMKILITPQRAIFRTGIR